MCPPRVHPRNHNLPLLNNRPSFHKPRRLIKLRVAPVCSHPDLSEARLQICIQTKKELLNKKQQDITDLTYFLFHCTIFSFFFSFVVVRDIICNYFFKFLLVFILCVSILLLYSITLNHHQFYFDKQ